MITQLRISLRKAIGIQYKGVNNLLFLVVILKQTLLRGVLLFFKLKHKDLSSTISKKGHWVGISLFDKDGTSNMFTPILVLNTNKISVTKQSFVCHSDRFCHV